MKDGIRHTRKKNQTIHHFRRNFKTKEKFLTKELKNRFPDLDMEFDRQISGGNSMIRPDVSISLEDHVIIVECDEHQHRGKKYSKDHRRSTNLANDFDRPVVLIRFNPDSYQDGDERVRGCFTASNRGKLHLCDAEWGRRMESLGDTIEHWLGKHPRKEITEVFMFYNS